MTAYDLVFLAVAAGMFAERGPRRWLAALVPFAAFAAGLAPIGPFGTPLVALAAVLLCPRTAPAALLLAVPAYATSVDALRAAALWAVATVLYESLESRLEDEAMPARLRGAPARLVVCAALYHAMLPAAYL